MSARCTDAEFTVVLPCKRLEPFQYFLLLDGFEKPAASDTTAEGPDRTEEVQPGQYFPCLFLGILASDKAAMDDCLPLEQSSVPCQENPVLDTGHFCQIGIIHVSGEGSIESEESENRCEFAQVHIEKKARFPERLWSEADDRGDVQGFEHRVDRNFVTIPDDVRETHGYPVDQDQLYLRMGNSNRFNDVFDGMAVAELQSELLLSTEQWKEVVQLGIHPDVKPYHLIGPNQTAVFQGGLQQSQDYAEFLDDRHVPWNIQWVPQLC